MRSLLITLGGIGLLVGLLCAIVVHELPTAVVGRRFSWGGYVPLDVEIRTPVSVSFFSWPSVLAFGGIGVAAGLVLALAMARSGWRLVRRTS